MQLSYLIDLMITDELVQGNIDIQYLEALKKILKLSKEHKISFKREYPDKLVNC